MKQLDLNLEEKYNISAELAAGNLVAFNSTQNQDIIFATAQKPLDYHISRVGARFFKIKTETGQHYQIFSSQGEKIRHITDIKNEKYNITDVQRLINNRLLLISGRSEFRGKNDYDKNGRIYSDSGKYLEEILLGDGIEDVQTTNDGLIWTSYFDEGIFGNFGWDEPIGSAGLIAWKANGEKIYEYNAEEGLDYMSDCYALNVESESVIWCYYYTDFPLVKIKNNKINDYWKIPISGSSSFAIYQNMALFLGSYEEKETLYLIKLFENHLAKVEKKIRLKNIKFIDKSCARGNRIFILSNKKIYELSVLSAIALG